MNTFGISIIICTFNGCRRIIPTLKALSEQNIPSGLDCELLIIDNASTDKTSTVALDYWESLSSKIPITILQEPKPGKSNALALGYNKAQYELMLLCDDDNWLQPDYLKTAAEIYASFPEIGLLGGYGRALFEPGEKPDWFSKWENCYVCGKHHTQNGFIEKMDFSIWGAGSVLRKTMWEFLSSNGFSFYNGTNGGKAMTEDAELSMAITFTGHQLYFDDRLWFKHDLRGGRISWKKLLDQQKNNGKNNAILYMYQMAFDHFKENKLQINKLFAKKIVGLAWSLSKSCMLWNNQPKIIFYFYILKELISNQEKYKSKSKESLKWIAAIKNTFPLKNADNFFRL